LGCRLERARERTGIALVGGVDLGGDDRMGNTERASPSEGPAQPRMIGHPLVQLQPEELPEQQAVGAAPLDPTLAVMPSNPIKCIPK
jgi:hypothetical protein